MWGLKGRKVCQEMGLEHGAMLSQKSWGETQQKQGLAQVRK